MKKLAMLCILPLLLLTSCDENFKTANGNKMINGARTYNYAYVKSQITGDKYYHISGWAEYGPEGGTYTNEGTALLAPYVGLELQLAVSKDVIYYYEPGLMYVLSQQYNSAFGTAIE